MMIRDITIIGGFLTLFAALLIMPYHDTWASDTQSVASTESFSESEKALPVRGTSSANVMEKYGEPQSKHGPIGDPPISTWQYEDFKVYFEYRHVITSVSVKDQLPQKLENIQ